MEIQRTSPLTKQPITTFDASASSTSNPFLLAVLLKLKLHQPKKPDLCLLLPFVARVWAASLTRRGTKSFLMIVKESLSTVRHRKPILSASSNALHMPLLQL
ncbi:hypothetical protein J1N35_006022 [Gossypium stocksii]|uniref:Uncharacterized protein n=1 Tax=Gossypium stocksii TaxID=47602 RepID=A0A9D3WF54_9ROSI|nr:hypothetical protein J1N35_006022 [Gossypium stocksii]